MGSGWVEGRCLSFKGKKSHERGGWGWVGYLHMVYRMMREDFSAVLLW